MPHALQNLGLFFLFLSFSPSLSDPVYKALGGDAVLRPPHTDFPIQQIKWKHNEDPVADWRTGDNFRCLGQFEGRCEVNTDTGALTIKGLKLNDSGIYTPEINGRDLDQIELSVISRVPKPYVETFCKTEMTFCLLTCKGNTADIEHIIPKWFVDGRDGPLDYLLMITKDTKGDSFRCMMKNQVSNETSESITNPFIKRIYRAKGEDVILRPPPMTDTLQRIEWKHNKDIAAEWYGDKFECLGQFGGRCEVNTDSGALTIKGLNLNDSGIYTPEINYKDLDKIKLSVISRVAKPSVKTFCNTEKSNCHLSCEGNTADTELITYKWFSDGRDGPSDKVLSITKSIKEHDFRCSMMNPVSNETSESITNPFLKQEWDWRALIIGLAVGLIVLVVIVVGAFFIYKHCREKWLGEQEEKWQRILEETKTLLNRLTDTKNQIREQEGTSEEGKKAREQYRKLQQELYDKIDEGIQLAEQCGIKINELYETVKPLRELYGTKAERRPLNQPPDGEGQPDPTQHLSNRGETESVTPETSNQAQQKLQSLTNMETVL